MKLKLIFPLAMIVLVAGCATHQKTPGTTFDLIGTEMQGAVAVSYTHLDVYKRQLPDWLQPLRRSGNEARTPGRTQ